VTDTEHAGDGPCMRVCVVRPQGARSVGRTSSRRQVCCRDTSRWAGTSLCTGACVLICVAVPLANERRSHRRMHHCLTSAHHGWVGLLWAPPAQRSRTNVKNAAYGPFGGELVVSMRPYREQDLAEVQSITAKYPGAHGAPVHWGDPTEIGIADVSSTDYGEPVELKDGEVPVFWACGVTPQTALLTAKLPVAITHSPGYMMVCDLLEEELLVDESVMQRY
jgi:hypothetical protein